MPEMTTWLTIGTILLLILGVPVAVAIGLSASFVLFWFQPVPLVAIPQLLWGAIEKYVLVAVPFFVLAGILMEYSGVARRLVNFSKALVGWSKGGLGTVNVVASFIFAGKSGSSIADTVSIGSIMIPEMERDGYPRTYAAGITAISSTLAVVVPPSILMVILGAVAEISIARLFIGGVIPGAAMGIAMIIQNYYISAKHGYGTLTAFSFGNIGDSLRKGLWALGTPAIIIGGIVSGRITPTEAGGAAVLYTLLIAGFIYRSLDWGVFYRTAVEAGKITGAVMFVVAASRIFTFILTFEGVPRMVASGLSGLTESPIVLLLILNVFLLAVGMVIDASVAIIVLVPILFPVIRLFGIDPIHFGILFVMNLGIGLVTPPFGVCMFSVCSIARIKMTELFRGSLPLYGGLLVVLLLATLFPDVVLFLPRLLFG